MTSAPTSDRPAAAAFSPRARWWVSPLTLAVVFTALGSLKPIHIDEAANYYYAVHIADHPLDPFGFQVFWYHEPQHANTVLTPPVMVSWWGAGVHLLKVLGMQPLEQPVALWKLWLWPFTLLFTFALDALLRRFARGLETPLLWMTVLSPTILPGLNLMPDVPALALSLGALAVFLRAIQTEGKAALAGACLAGLLAGLATQTKYTGFLAPAVLLVAAGLFGRMRLALLAAAEAVLLFVAWEWVTARLYGESHFLYQLRHASRTLPDRLGLLPALITTLGGVAPVLGLLGLAALGAGRRVVWAGMAVVALGYLTVACVGVNFTVQAEVTSLFGSVPKQDFEFSLADVLYFAWGLGLSVIGAMVGGRLCRFGGAGWRGRLARWRGYRAEWFLMLWLLLEVAGYFALSPFPAVRRVMGMFLAASVLTGRLASRTCRFGERRALVNRLAVCSGVLGLGFLAVDVLEAHTQKEAAETLARQIHRQGEGGMVWYVGHWGFQYYAERAGMVPVVPGQSRLRVGDWLILPDRRLIQQLIEVDQERTVLVNYWASRDRVPLRTLMGYYGGWTPLDHRPLSRPRLLVEVRRVVGDFVPAFPRSGAAP